MFNSQNQYLRIRHLSFSVGVGIICLLFLIPNQAAADIIHPVNDLVYLTNQQRIRRDLSPLAVNPKLTLAAQQKAHHMLENNYFEHTSPDGREPWDFVAEADYHYVYAGENLAINFLNSRETFQAWVDSPSHLENILFPYYQEIGIATQSAEINGKITTVTVQMFGSRNDFIPLSTYFLDANFTQPVSTSLVDNSLKELNKQTGYVSSSVATARTWPKFNTSQNSSSYLWSILITYLLLLTGLLFLFTKKELFYRFVKKPVSYTHLTLPTILRV